MLTSFKQSVTLLRAEGNPFLPECERLCCHANPGSSGVWECVWFYDLMTPVGSDQWVRLSVARCEFTSSYAKPGCDSYCGLVVGMEPHFWTLGRLRKAQRVRKCWIGGGRVGGWVGGGWGQEPTGHSGVKILGIQLHAVDTVAHWEAIMLSLTRWKWFVNRSELRRLIAKRISFCILR